MKNFIKLLLSFAILTSCNDTTPKTQKTETTKETNSTSSKKSEFAIVIHGGAGTILKSNMTAELELEYRNTLEEAIRVGYDILEAGGSSLDAVQHTITVLEDSPLFNAGKGAVFTNAETNELDASIMDGKTLKAGAVAGVTIVKNPIHLARSIMDNSPHVMLSGKGAEAFAKTEGIELVDPKYFYTDSRFQSLQKLKASEKNAARDKTAFVDPALVDSKFGTVGCVALDKNGNLAAGTSTGGMTNKKYGRIGDAPIIGAGTYANNATCAVSSTGWGEYFIRAVVAHDISALMDYKSLTLQEAAYEVIQNKIPKLGGDGGIIAVDKNGQIVMEFNTEGMYRASMDDTGQLKVSMYKE